MTRRLLRSVWRGFIAWAMGSPQPPAPDYWKSVLPSGAQPVPGCTCQLCTHPDVVHAMNPELFEAIHYLETDAMNP